MQIMSDFHVLIGTSPMPIHDNGNCRAVKKGLCNNAA